MDEAIRGKFARKEKIPGFGHRVYHTEDPRATHLRQMSQELGKRAGNTAWFDMSQRIEALVKAEKKLNPNVDFYSASTYYTLGIPIDLYTPIFAVSRMSGWTAHVLEQYANNRLIRPRADYTGPRLPAALHPAGRSLKLNSQHPISNSQGLVVATYALLGSCEFGIASCSVLTYVAIAIVIVVYAVAFRIPLRRRKTVEKKAAQSWSGMILTGASFAALFIGMPRRIEVFGSGWYVAPTIVAGIASVLTVAGAVFIVWSQRTLGKQWSFSARVVEGHQLITHGPYEWYGTRSMPRWRCC